MKITLKRTIYTVLALAAVVVYLEFYYRGTQIREHVSSDKVPQQRQQDANGFRDARNPGHTSKQLKPAQPELLLQHKAHQVVVGARSIAGYVFHNTSKSVEASRWVPQYDPNGYIMFCLTMGNAGNQLDQLLGSIAFAKRLNRTLVLTPFIPGETIHFTQWFKLEPLLRYHRTVLVEDFMQHVAPSHWPKTKRIGFCAIPLRLKVECDLKKSERTAAFWNSLGVYFYNTTKHQITYQDEKEVWDRTYPLSEYPVLTFQGAPASYPILAKYRGLQRLLVFSDTIQMEARGYIDANFPGETFVGIHLRDGNDWVGACGKYVGHAAYMSSPQCLDGTNITLTKDMCLQSKEEIVRLTRNTVISTGARVVFVAYDADPMITVLEEGLQDLEVTLHIVRQRIPIIDLAILTMSDHFIGNCVSSFTAFVKRARDVAGKPTSFWGFS